jgi:hypothetical protein
MFPVRHENHLHIEKQDYPRNKLWRPMFPVRYGYNFYLNPGQPRTLLKLKLVGILTINLILT